MKKLSVKIEDNERNNKNFSRSLRIKATVRYVGLEASGSAWKKTEKDASAGKRENPKRFGILVVTIWEKAK